MEIQAVPALLLMLHNYFDFGGFLNAKNDRKEKEPPSWSKKWEKLESESAYDFTFDLEDICKVPESGIQISIASHISLLPHLPLDFFSSCGGGERERKNIVGVLGRNGSGKTWVLSKLCLGNKSRPQHLFQRRRGLGVKSSKCSQFVALDVAGAGGCASTYELEQRYEATELLLRELVLKLSRTIIIVVNHVRRLDARYIDKVLDDLLVSRRVEDIEGQLFVVHNFMNIEKVEEVESLICEEIEGALGAQETSNTIPPNFTRHWNSSKKKQTPFGVKEINIVHFIAARETTEAGRKWNEKTFELMRDLIVSKLSFREIPNFLKSVQEYVSFRLPSFLKFPNKEKGTHWFELNSISGQLDLKFFQVEKEHEEREKNHQNEQNQPKILELPLKSNTESVLFATASRESIRPQFNIDEGEDFVDLQVNLAGLEKDTLECQFAENFVSIKAVRRDLSVNLGRKKEGGGEEEEGEDGQQEQKEDNEVILIPAGKFWLSHRFHFQLDVKKRYVGKNVGDLYWFRFFKLATVVMIEEVF